MPEANVSFSLQISSILLLLAKFSGFFLVVWHILEGGTLRYLLSGPKNWRNSHNFVGDIDFIVLFVYCQQGGRLLLHVSIGHALYCLGTGVPRPSAGITYVCRVRPQKHAQLPRGWLDCKIEGGGAGYKKGHCKSWTVDCGLDCGLDYGLCYCEWRWVLKVSKRDRRAS